MKQSITKNREAGFTLIELLIGIAVTLLVMGALIEVFSSQQKMYYQQSQMAKSQAAARTALFQLSRDVRMAGYTGVPLGSDILARTAPQNNYYPVLSLKDGSTLITGSAGSAGPMAYAATILNDITNAPYNCQSDAIEIRGNFRRAVTTSLEIINGTDTEFKVANPDLFLPKTGFNSPGWVVVGKLGLTADVKIFPITDVDDGNSTIKIGARLPGDTVMDFSGTDVIFAAPLYSRVYFATSNGAAANVRQKLMVANYKPTNDNNNVVMAGAPVEFAVDIADFQVSYDLASTIADDQMNMSKRMICNPCSIRNITLNVTTMSDKFRENKPLLRDFTTSVQVRNLGYDTKQCLISAAPCAWQY